MSAPLVQDEALTWGVLAFVGPDESESTFEIEALDGTNFGNPQPVIEVLRSLLVDGAQASVTGWENREAPIRLRVTGNDGEALAEAEAALFEQVQLDQPPPLVWTSPVGLSATTVFDTVVAKLEADTADGWDLDEVLRGDRFYLLTLTCLPFARAVESVVVPAIPVPVDPTTPTWTDIDDGGSLTPGGTYAGTWTHESDGSSPASGTGSDASGTYVYAQAGIGNPARYLRLVRHFDTPLAVGTDYLAVDVIITRPDGSGVAPQGVWKIHDGVGYRDAIATQPLPLGLTRLYFADIPAAVSDLKVLYDFTVAPSALAQIRVYNVARTDTLGSSTTTTHRQQSRLASVWGSAPTQAQIRFYDATPADLGADILVYTTRNTAFPPNLRTWIPAGGSEVWTALAGLVSGSWHTLATPTKFLIPAELLRLGTYALVARMDIATAGTLTWQARMTTLGGASAVGSGLIVEGEVDLPETTGYEVLDLAAMILPVVEVEGTNYAVELTLTGTADMTLDEAWLFALDDGVLTWVQDSEGLDWIEIRSPELGAARPSVWGGRNAVGTGASCIDWKCRSFGAHRFDPGDLQVFTVATTSLESQAEIEFFPRFHSNVWAAETD